MAMALSMAAYNNVGQSPAIISMKKQHLNNCSKIKSSANGHHESGETKPRSKPSPSPSHYVIKKRRLRCNTLYSDIENSPTACSFHGHTTGEKGLFALAPPHQGIDGEWNGKSGVIVYKWNDKSDRPNTGMPKWKMRWSCCAEYGRDSPPCRRGCHVSYDDGHTLY